MTLTLTLIFYCLCKAQDPRNIYYIGANNSFYKTFKITFQILEFVRDGDTVEQVQEKSKRILGRRQVQDGVDKILKCLAIEAMFTTGLKVIQIENPICDEFGDLKLALHGSHLSSVSSNNDVAMKEEPSSPPQVVQHRLDSDLYPGKVIALQMGGAAKQAEVISETNLDDGEIVEVSVSSAVNGNTNPQFIEINKGRGESVFMTVTNLSAQTVRVGSHFNFVEANKCLQFDRSMAFGKRLNIPSGEVVEFQPKSSKVVSLVSISGLK